jgi:hypothetical protein
MGYPRRCHADYCLNNIDKDNLVINVFEKQKKSKI